MSAILEFLKGFSWQKLAAIVAIIVALVAFGGWIYRRLADRPRQVAIKPVKTQISRGSGEDFVGIFVELEFKNPYLNRKVNIRKMYALIQPDKGSWFRPETCELDGELLKTESTTLHYKQWMIEPNSSRIVRYRGTSSINADSDLRSWNLRIEWEQDRPRSDYQLVLPLNYVYRGEL